MKSTGHTSLTPTHTKLLFFSLIIIFFLLSVFLSVSLNAFLIIIHLCLFVSNFAALLIFLPVCVLCLFCLSVFFSRLLVFLIVVEIPYSFLWDFFITVSFIQSVCLSLPLSACQILWSSHFCVF